MRVYVLNTVTDETEVYQQSVASRTEGLNSALLQGDIRQVNSSSNSDAYSRNVFLYWALQVCTHQCRVHVSGKCHSLCSWQGLPALRKVNLRKMGTRLQNY